MKLKKNNNKNILVLGGSGRIGTQIVKSLISNDYQVYVMDKKRNESVSSDYINTMILMEMAAEV